MRPPRFKLSARLDERFVAPVRRDPARARAGFILLVGVVLAIHVAVFAWLLYRDSQDPVAVAQATEVPVEVVVEPPKPPPDQKQPPPKPPAPQRDEALEKPATSAPRAPSKDPAETRESKARTEAPRAAAPSRAGVRPPLDKAGPAPTPAASPRLKAAAVPKREDDHRDAEALDRARPGLDDTPKADPTTTQEGPETASPDAAHTLSSLLDLPSYSFAAATKMAPFPPGQEDDRYLAVVYGMVMSKNRYSGSSAAQRGERGTVSVTFVVDPTGALRSETVRRSSGQADLDALALLAVRTAAPFPPPPGSGPQQLIATMSFGTP